jgi:hypothetical protein
MGSIVMAGGFVWNAAVMTSQIQANTSRITALEISDRMRGDKINSIDVRTASIEAKIDMLLTSKASR